MRTEIKRSLINKYFSKELLYKIYLTTKQHDLDNNEKAMLNTELLTEYKSSIKVSFTNKFLGF